MYLIDTSIISEARRGTPQPVAWRRSVDPLSIHLSALTLGEIQPGITFKLNSNPKAATYITEWQRSCGDISGLLDATAIVHDLILVTRNIGDFEDVDVFVIDPWERPA